MPYIVTNGLCSLDDVKAALRLAPTDTDDDARIGLAIDAASRLIERVTRRRFWQDSVASPRVFVAESPMLCPIDDFESAFVVNDAVTVAGSPNVTSAMATWDASHVGNPVMGAGIPNATYVGSIIAGNNISLSSSPTSNVPVNATQSASSVALSTGVIVQTDPAGNGSFSLTWQPLDFQLEPLNKQLNGHPWPYTKIRAVRSQSFPVYGGIAYPTPYTQALTKVTTRWGWSAVPTDVQKAGILQAIALLKADDAPFGATPFAEIGVIRMRQALHPTAAMLIEPYESSTVLVA